MALPIPFCYKVSEQLTLKYGKEFGQQARSNTNNTVNERVCEWDDEKQKNPDLYFGL